MSKKTVKPAVEENVEKIVIPTVKTRKTLSQETLTEIAQMVSEGKTRGQIVKEYNALHPESPITYTEVYMAVVKIQKANPDLKVASREEKPFKQEIFKLRAEGKSCKEVAEALGLEYSQVYTTYIRDPKLG